MKRLEGPDILIPKLSERRIENSVFIFRIMDETCHVYADNDLTAALMVQKDSDHCMFWGDWEDVEMPLDLLPKDGIFVSACAPDIIEVLKQHFKPDGEWPCWHYLAPGGYDPGEWDRLGPLEEDDAPFIAKHWELGGDDKEVRLRDRIRRFDSACVRQSGKPVAWCGMHFEMDGVGNLGFAHTLDEHRKKGYASMVTKSLVNRLGERGMRATSHVIKDNGASIRLSQSLGFERIGELTWAYFLKD